MLRNKLIKKHGRIKAFSLVEIIITTALFATLTTIITQFIVSNIKLYQQNYKKNVVENRIAQTMREFEFSTRAASSIDNISANQISYYRYFDLESEYPKLVRYYVEGNQFKVGQTDPIVNVDGTPPSYPLDQEECVLLIDGLENTTSLFKYFDEDNQELTSEIQISEIRMIKLNIVLTEKNMESKPLTGTTTVSLRNIKDNL